MFENISEFITIFKCALRDVAYVTKLNHNCATKYALQLQIKIENNAEF